MYPLIEFAPPPPLTMEQIFMFHKMDRDLYSNLTNDLGRDPVESMSIFALWLWLEKAKYSKLIKAISTLPNFLINELANEAVICINFLHNPSPIDSFWKKIDLPLTQSLLGSDMSLHFFSLNKQEALSGVGKAFNETCLSALQDLMQEAIERNAARALDDTQIAVSSIDHGFSRLNINSRDMINQQFSRPPGNIHEDDRTMFVTFSKGYPVPERDIREFFKFTCGDCIESLHLQDVPIGEQALYARVVFYTPDVIEMILNGEEKAKFTIRGRHMWMRKFISKRKRNLSSESPAMHSISGPGSSSRSFAID